MIMNNNDFLVEAKADLDRFNKWIQDGASRTFSHQDIADEMSKFLYDKFIEYRQKLKSPYNDVYYWMKNSTFKEFDDYIEDLFEKEKTNKQIKQKEQEGAELIYKDDTWKVYHITNYEASAKYGKGTKWCITGTERWNDGSSGEDTFKEYHEKNNVEFYFFIKNGTEKYAVALYPDGETTEIFNAEDVSIAYIPDAPHIEDFPDVSTKDEKKLLINAIASDKIEDSVILNAIVTLATNGYDDEQGDYDIIFASTPEEVSSIMKDFIPDAYLEFNAVATGRMTPEEYHRITGDTISELDVKNDYFWGGDLPEVVVDEDKFITKEEACDPKNYQGHKYWYFFEDRTSWDPYDLYWADDKVGLFNNVRQLLNFTSMYEFLESLADTILKDVKEGRVSKDILTNLGISDDYISSLSEKYHLTESLDSDYDSLVKMSINNMNKFLDDFGFEVKLVDDCEFETDALGVFLNNIQDNASVFPIALNKDAIIKGSEKYDVELDTAILTTVAHEVGHGIFEYLEDFYDLEEADEESVVEEFARDYYDNNLSNNTLYRLLLDFNIDEELDESLLEMRGKGNISDEKILKYVDECIADLKKLNFGFSEEDCLTYDDIDVEEGDANRTFGTMFLPHNGQGNFKLVLNKYMFNESEKAIKNTIYHELCHYIVDKIAIEKGIIYSNGKGWYIRNSYPYAKDYKGHGKIWKRVADIVGRAVDHDITRTNDFDLHTEMGKHYDENVKYIVKCKHCGNEFKYNRKTDFIKSILDGNGHTDTWWCQCDDGTKSHDFEIVKGN